MTSRRATPALPASLAVTLVAACLVSLLSFGARSAFGLFTEPLTRELGLSRETWAVAIALQNIAWGVAQPLAGFLADRKGSRWVMVGGACLYLCGVAGLAISTTPIQICLTAGLLAGLGMGGASYITVLAALGRVMPDAQRSWALGLGTAAGSLGQFAIVPLVQASIGALGWRGGAWVLAGALGVLLAATLLVRGDKPPAAVRGHMSMSARDVLATALALRSYRLLVLGFFVCGFQLAFITTHLPAYLADKGLGGGVASWAIAMVGLFNVGGAYIAGQWGARHSKKNLLAALYFGRGLATLLFVMMPITVASTMTFGAVMGLMWLSTVPPTSGLVATFFGTRYMATLFGVVFFSHQVGSFLGVYLGGLLYARTGSYDVVWWISIVLSGLAGLVNLPIRERQSPHFDRLAVA